MQYQLIPIKTEWRVRESTKKLPKNANESPIFDLGGKKSKFRRIPFLHMAILHISMRYQLNPIQTLKTSSRKYEKTAKKR